MQQEQKVEVNFDLGNEEMVRQAFDMPEIYREMLIHTMMTMSKYIREVSNNGLTPKGIGTRFEDEFIKVDIKL